MLKEGGVKIKLQDLYLNIMEGIKRCEHSLMAQQNICTERLMNDVSK